MVKKIAGGFFVEAVKEFGQEVINLRSLDKTPDSVRLRDAVITGGLIGGLMHTAG